MLNNKKLKPIVKFFLSILVFIVVYEATLTLGYLIWSEIVWIQKGIPLFRSQSEPFLTLISWIVGIGSIIWFNNKKSKQEAK